MEIGLSHLVDAGAVVHAEESRRYADARQAAGGQRGPTDLGELQAARRALPAGPVPSRAVERTARALGREVPVRIIGPSGGASRAAHLDIHGGGFYLDSAARNDARNEALADALGVTVVSVDYRLAPEHPWPAAPDDCETAAAWLLDDGLRTLGVDRLLIGGASAGATLAMTTLLRLRDRGVLDRVIGAALSFGAYDLSGGTPGGRRYAEEWFIEAYAGHVADRTDPDVSPLFGDLHGLPPTLLVVGALDVLLEDNLAMAARLAAAGNEVDLRVYPDALHGFTSHPTGMAAFARERIVSWLDGRLGSLGRMADIDVRDDGEQHRYEIRVDGALAGFAQYHDRAHRRVFVHTEIDDAYEGQGLGSKLASGALDDVRAKGLQVVPLCPFIAGYIDRHPAYADLVDQGSLAALDAPPTG